MSLYSPAILRLATQIGHKTPISPPFYWVERRSRVCGSHLKMQARLNAAGAVEALCWQPSLCALGQGVLGLFEPHVMGLRADVFKRFDRQFRQMLAGDEGALGAPFQSFDLLRVAVGHKSRHGGILLPFDCLMALFDGDCEKESAP